MRPATGQLTAVKIESIHPNSQTIAGMMGSPWNRVRGKTTIDGAQV